jgi:hypothetical protein
MGRKKNDRLATLERLRDEATLLEHFPDYKAAVKAEELVLKWDRWALEQQLLRAKIDEGKSKAKIARVKARYAEALIKAEILERQSIARQEYIKAKEAKRREGSEKPPDQYPDEFSPEKTVGPHPPVPQTTGGGGGHLP